MLNLFCFSSFVIFVLFLCDFDSFCTPITHIHSTQRAYISLLDSVKLPKDILPSDARTALYQAMVRGYGVCACFMINDILFMYYCDRPSIVLLITNAVFLFSSPLTTATSGHAVCVGSSTCTYTHVRHAEDKTTSFLTNPTINWRFPSLAFVLGMGFFDVGMCCRSTESFSFSLFLLRYHTLLTAASTGTDRALESFTSLEQCYQNATLTDVCFLALKSLSQIDRSTLISSDPVFRC